MSVSATSPVPNVAAEPVQWWHAAPDGHAPDPPVVNGNDEMSFGEFLSAINPLQHIPVIGTIYRAITGDTLSPAAKVVGGTLLGGPVGLVLSAGDAMIAEATGSDVGEKVLAMVSPSPDQPTVPENLAAASVAPSGGKPLPLEGQRLAGSSPPSDGVVAPTAQVALPPELQALATSLAKGPSTDPAPAARAPVLAAAKPAAPTDPGKANRDLAYYWRQAEARPVVASGPMPTSASRVLPYARPVSHPEKAAAPQVAEAVAAVAPAAGPKPEAPPTPAAGAPTDAWFAAAMARGLDRYEAAKRKPDRGASIDRAE